MSIRDQLVGELRESESAIAAARTALTEVSALAIKLEDDSQRVQVLRAIALAKTKLDEGSMWAGWAEGILQR